jgi:hypothetical protein
MSRPFAEIVYLHVRLPTHLPWLSSVRWAQTLHCVNLQRLKPLEPKNSGFLFINSFTPRFPTKLS